jgi:ABC-type Zn uptake system ZnuABC Zn-binding protein ZnuA
VGEQLAEKYDFEKLGLLYQRGRLQAFLKKQGEENLLGGWLGAMLPYYGTKVVDHHPSWPYFARAFGIEVVDHLEPLPGIPPTTRHLNEVVTRMRAEKVPVVIVPAYYDPRYARFVSEHTGATVVPLAHQVGAREGTDDYLSMTDYNVRQLAAALGGGR